MAIRRKDRHKAEFGDFQTPLELARQACRVVAQKAIRPRCIVEPTCGLGAFVVAAMETFPGAERVIAADVNRDYITSAREAIANHLLQPERAEFLCESFFTTPWAEILASLPEPVLLVGNPPWVTNSDLGSLGSDNHPAKKNFQKHAGFDAITGKSNFDISEWMLIHQLEWLQDRDATVAMLCKTAVARKVLQHAWKNGYHVQDAAIYLVDAAEHFGASVDACFFICRTNGHCWSYDCPVFPSLDATEPRQTFGFRDKHLVAHVRAYESWKHLQGLERYRWRSGIKHDCADVMELKRVGSDFENCGSPL